MSTMELERGADEGIGVGQKKRLDKVPSGTMVGR